MNIKIQRFYNRNGIETGAILSAIYGAPTNAQQKAIIEGQLTQYAFNQLYPGHLLSIHQEVNIDTPAIVVIININDLIDENATI